LSCRARAPYGDRLWWTAPKFKANYVNNEIQGALSFLEIITVESVETVEKRLCTALQGVFVAVINVDAALTTVDAALIIGCNKLFEEVVVII